MRQDIVYLDNQASTPIDPRVVEAMLPWMFSQANPHSTHVPGRRAAAAVETAREQIASLVGAATKEVFFTSGATEAANIAIHALAARSGTAIASSLEHPCISEVLSSLEPRLRTKTIPTDESGIVDPDVVADAFEDDASFVAVMAVNNEIGTVQPVAEIGRSAEFAGIPYLCDLSQAAGKIPIDVADWGISAGLLSGHKIYGPQGIGALLWRSHHVPAARTFGGGQENGVRAGTLPTALCVGFGHAAMLAAQEMQSEVERIAKLSDILRGRLNALIPDIRMNGAIHHRIPHNLNLYVPDVDADALCASLPDVAISTGSACSSGAIAPSPVLAALGYDDARLRGSFRIGIGRHTTVSEVERAADSIASAVASLRSSVSVR